MDQSELSKINQEVYRRFPELRGSKPSQHNQGNNTLLVYQGQVDLPDNKTLNRTVRVVVDQGGEILKISTSR